MTNDDMLSKLQIKQILKDRGLQPTKKFGQNFLINQKPIRQMITAADIKSSDTILEIGPGLGALTQELILTGAKIIAIEKDRNLVAVLRKQFKNAKNLEIIEGDAKYNNYKNHKDYKIIANLPYYLTAPIIRQFLETANPPELMVFLIQKQVGQRICAKPPRMNLLAVSVQVYATPKIISYVSQKCFWPMPEVDGAIIKITPHHKGAVATTDRDHFFKILKASFSHPRKMLISNLAGGLEINRDNLENTFSDLNIPPKARAENLAVNDWIKLAENLIAPLSFLYRHPELVSGSTSSY